MSADWRDALGALLPDGYEPEPEAQSAEEAKPWPKLKVEVDRKRAGKTATIISGFDPDDERCAALAAELKRMLAVGGSSRGGEILLQGDVAQKAKAALPKAIEKAKGNVQPKR